MQGKVKKKKEIEEKEATRRRWGGYCRGEGRAWWPEMAVPLDGSKNGERERKKNDVKTREGMVYCQVWTLISFPLSHGIHPYL